MKQNASWDVQLPTFRQGNRRLNEIFPLKFKRKESVNHVSPLIVNDDELQQKKMEREDSDLFYSTGEHSSNCSLLSVSTEQSCRDSSGKPGRDTSTKSNLSYSTGEHNSNCSLLSVSTEQSCKDSSRKSRRDTSLKSILSRSRRKRNRKLSLTKTALNFDPSLKPQKSCLKQPSMPDDTPSETLPQKQGPIRFCEEVSVREVRSSKSLVKNDCRLLWFQDDENAEIRDNIQRLLKRVNCAGISKTNGKRYCTRGLERFVDPNDDSDIERLKAEEAVLFEQYQQRESGNYDDLRIAAIYFQSTRTMQHKAILRASEDALIAKAIFKEESLRSTKSGSGGSFHASLVLSGLWPSSKRASSFSSLTKQSKSLGQKEQQDQELRRSMSCNQQDRYKVPSVA